MGLDEISAGKQIPDNINVIIEIPAEMSPVKYEMDKNSGLICVDRFLSTSMVYPCNYGFVPHTLSEDGDPVDVLVVTPYPLITGCVIAARPIGMLRMTDDAGKDTKILAVPVNKTTQLYANINAPVDLGTEFIAMIEHFFAHYKDLEKGKWSKVEGWGDSASAKAEIMSSVKRFEMNRE